MNNKNNSWDNWYPHFVGFLPQEELVPVPESDFIVDLEKEIELLNEASVNVPQPYNMLVTPQTLDALYRAKENLKDDEQLGISSAYRGPEMLTTLWIKRLDHVKGKFPEWSLDEQIKFASRYTASPVHPGNPPHSRGNAVDVTLYSGGKKLIMGELEWKLEENYSDMAFDAYEKRNPAIHNNRMYLRKVMTNAGFIPYDKEYWHFGLTEVFPKRG